MLALLSKMIEKEPWSILPVDVKGGAVQYFTLSPFIHMKHYRGQTRGCSLTAE